MSDYEPTAVSKEIASRLRGQIARYDVSQAELATLCGVSQSQFSKIIRAARPMTVDHLATICDALAIDMGELLSSVESLVLNQGIRASAISYVDEEVRLDPPYTWSDDSLDGWGAQALARLRNVGGVEDDAPVLSREEEQELRKSEHDLAAYRGHNEANIPHAE
ncbi:helix-turn-helix transcriptional regulator [Microbacterium sp. CBA3102]|uniref:helix-turn-helix domain-containing protein n=1 Tax=Microbacterium sp. CBA3102 TaxID=2603598 RepID=UPI0011BB2C48|nr:helix-turn-helix transcriptional regulator [Microbacterium sp. CBA3102]QEA27084.1 helix-turn-helix transcriptional regulator [Microbacterium sp. CBA3102]